MLLALIEHYSNGNKAQFASRLGITPQGLSTWIKRDKLDIELVFSKCEGLSAGWLLTGQGEMLKTNSIIGGTPSDEEHCTDYKDKPINPEKQEISSIISQLLDTIKEQAEEIGRLKALINEH